MSKEYADGNKEAGLTKGGHEIPDPRPMRIPAGFKRPPTLAEQVRRLVQTSVSEWAANNGFETFEESEDFEVDDDTLDPRSPYEEHFDPELGRAVTDEERRRHLDFLRVRREAEEADRIRREEAAELAKARRRARAAKKVNQADPGLAPNGNAAPSTSDGKSAAPGAK